MLFKVLQKLTKLFVIDILITEVEVEVQLKVHSLDKK